MHGRQQAQLFALLRLAFQVFAVAGQVRVLAFQGGRGGLAARVGVGSRVQHQHLHRGAGRQDTAHRPEADVIGRTVAADGHDRGHQREFLVRELFPFRSIGWNGRAGRTSEDGPGLPQRQNVHRQIGRQTLVNAFRQGLRVLEQAVDPRLLVRVKRRGRGINRGTPGRVCDHRGRRAPPSCRPFVTVQTLLQTLAHLVNQGAKLSIGHGLALFLQRRH